MKISSPYTPIPQKTLGQRVGRPASSAQPNFGGPLGPGAISGFFNDVVGVWLPKAPFALARSWTNFCEETFLEFVEDAAFYFTVPLSGYYFFGPLFHKLYRLGKDVPTQAIGTSLKEVEKKLAVPITKKLVAAKSGALLGALALAAGFEYMIQHSKNVMTAKYFKTKNFTAVAGLEAAQEKPRNGYEDPVHKAERRLYQVGAVVAGLVGAALLFPWLIVKSDKAFRLATAVLKKFDFKSTTKTFDLSKPVLAALVAIGGVSYLDAARDSLERKETGTRLAFVMPYLVVGGELAENIMGKLAENKTISDGLQRFKIKDKIRFLDDRLFQKESFLNLGKLKDAGVIEEEIKALGLSQKLADSIRFWRGSFIKWSTKAFKLGVMGAGLCALAYHQTHERFKKEEKAKIDKRHHQQLELEAQRPPAISRPISAPVHRLNPFESVSYAQSLHPQAFSAAPSLQIPTRLYAPASFVQH